jgi:periplasmic divalent cation tolerance protein
MRVVLCNCPPDHADRIARALVEGGHAACVTALAARSTYRWEGKLHQDDEVTLMIKVSAEAAPRLRDALRALHPYEVPEIVALPVDPDASHAPYLDWVRENSRG